jgi:hypothetical protein
MITTVEKLEESDFPGTDPTDDFSVRQGFALR